MITLTSTLSEPVRLDVRVAGVAAYLDQFAITQFTKSEQLGNRFLQAFVDANASLLVSGVNIIELSRLQGGHASSVRAFLNELGARWAPIKSNPFEAIKAEEQGNGSDACLSKELASAFFQDRLSELENADGMIPVSADNIFRLGSVLDWANEHRDQMTEHAARLDGVLEESVQKLVVEQSVDGHFLDRAIPPMPWNSRTPAKFALTNLMRILVQEAKGHPLKKGDGRDFFHAVMGAAYGSFAALDKHWKRRVEQLPKPNGLAKIYYKPELESLVRDFESYANNCRSG